MFDAINVAMREIFVQLAYGRSQTAFSEGGLPVGASLEDLGKGLRSQVGTIFSTKAKGCLLYPSPAPPEEIPPNTAYSLRTELPAPRR